MMPTHPTTHFVMSQSHLPFALLEHFFDTVAFAAHTNHFPQRLMLGVAERVGLVRLDVQRPRHQQTFQWTGTAIIVLGLHHGIQHTHAQRAFLSVPDC